VRYTVVWSQDAEQDLARIWNDSSNRDDIARAANSLDRKLSDDPLKLGESRSGGLRVAHNLPLGIRFAIAEKDRLVRVVAVWLCRRRPK
jgi:plasmid stabilization system protein ParE